MSPEAEEGDSAFTEEACRRGRGRFKDVAGAAKNRQTNPAKSVKIDRERERAGTRWHDTCAPLERLGK